MIPRSLKIAALAAVFGVATARADDAVDSPESARVDSHTRLGELRLFVPLDRSRAVVFLFSDAAGWRRSDDATARALVERGAFVAGVDLSTYLAKLRASDDGCHYLISEIEALSKGLQRQRGLGAYRSPILVGAGSAATLVYAALAQAPAATLAGAVSYDPSGRLDTKVPLCAGAVAHRAEGGGFSYASKSDLPGFLRIAARRDDLAVAKLAGGLPRATVSTIDPSWERAEVVASMVLGTDTEEPELPPALSDLPLIELPAADTPRFLAVLLSGDGGWRDIDKQVAEALASGDVAVVGVDSLRYFWERRDPLRVAGDLERIIWHYRALWSVDRVALIGYSFGADVIPAAVNRLSPEARATLAQVSLLAISDHTPFEVHVAEWLGADEDDDGSGDPIAPEVLKLDPGLLQCFYGQEEKASLCRQPPFGTAERIETTGGHHFDGDYRKLAARIVEGLRRRTHTPAADPLAPRKP